MKIFSKGLSVLSKSLLTLLLITSSPLAFSEDTNTEENLIINGSFENYGHLNRGSWGTFKSIEGWVANRGLLEVQENNVSGIGSVDGIAKIELDSHYNSRIFQKLNNLEEGETYRLTLNYSPRINHRNSNKIRVKWNNQKLAILNGTVKGWTEYSYDVVARAKNKLKLHAIGRNDSYGGLIDDVSLVCITCDGGVNSAPIANAQSTTVTENSVDNVITLTATDADNDTLSFTVTDPSNGSLSGQAPNLTYTPEADFFGTDSFEYTVSDGIDSDTATVSITVTEIVDENSAPIASPQDITVLENSADNSIVLIAEDADFDDLSFTTTDPSSGTLSGQAPNLTYTPEADFFGTDSFEYTVSDGIDSDTETVSITVDEVADPTSTINTRITTPDGSEIGSVEVLATLVSDSTSTMFTSDANGNANLELIAGEKYIIKLDKTGFATQVTPVKTPAADGIINLDITMIERGLVQTFVSENGATLTGDNGAEVTIQPNSFVDTNGIPVTGVIEVTITPVDVSNPNSLAAFPGEFTGTTASGDTPIISFGTVEYKFTQNGVPLQLAQGATADILIPIYINTYQNGLAIGEDDIIPLWSLNEETGIWLQEGTGIVVESDDSPTGLALLASVSHFTWWNCDVSMNAAQAIVTVNGSQAGTALIKATTNADIGFRSSNVDTVAEIGVATAPLFIPSNGQVCFIADINFNDGTSATTTEECVTAAPNSTVNITLISSQPGPVNIVANGSEGPVTVNGFLDLNIERIRLSPTTSEASVSYSVLSGSLPPGINLNSINSSYAEIVGSSSVPGSYSAVIVGTDSDSTSDSVTVNINISSDISPPVLNSFVNLETDLFNFNGTFDLNTFNTGGLASNWELRWNFQFEQTPPPPEITLDPATGILTLSSCTNQNGFNVFWYGSVFAENISGSDEQDIRVYCSPGIAQ